MRTRITQKVAVSVVFVAAMFMSIMDVTIVNVALPTIGHDLGVSPAGVDAVSISFLVSLAVFIPASGWLGDRFGGKRVLLAAIVVFTLASALCGLAQNMGELVAFRVLQGVGGGMLAPVGMAMLFRTFPPSERLRAASILTVPTTLAPALGPVLGGLLVDDLSWRWVFFVNLPIGALALVFGILFLDDRAETKPGHFDVPGFLLSGVGLGALMYGVSEAPVHGWSSAGPLTGIIAGVVLLGFMVVVELRTREPIVALRLLSNRLFRSANGVMILGSMAFLGTLYAIALYYQDGRGLSPLQSGLNTFPEAVGVMLGAQLASRVLYPLLGPRRHISIGLTGVALSIGLLAALSATSSLWFARALMFSLGLCMAQVFVPAQAVAFATIPSSETGKASTMFNAVRQLGGAVGVAALTTAVVLAGNGSPEGAVGTVTPYRVAFLVAAVLALLAIGSALTIDDAKAVDTMPQDARARRRFEPQGPATDRVPAEAAA